MHKKLLLATVLVSSIHIANATCTPPTTLKCNCAHPIINSEGKLACGASYCGDKKCMPDGSCCETEKYCESSELGKQCCADGQTCDTTSGCILADDGCTWVTLAGKTFCLGYEDCSYSADNLLACSPEQAQAFCAKRNMTLASIYDVCPSFDASKLLEVQCWDGEYNAGLSTYWTLTKSSRTINYNGNSYPYYYLISLNGGGIKEGYYFYRDGNIPTAIYYNLQAICKP